MRYGIALMICCLFSLSKAQTFRNYRLTVGGGVQFMPLFFIGKEPFKNSALESIKPTIQAELPISSDFALAVRTTKQFQSFAATSKPEFDGFSYVSDGISSQVNSVFTGTEIQARIYSTHNGYMAPWGRYIYYGFFWGSWRANIQEATFKLKDQLGHQVEGTLAQSTRKSPNYYGLSLGYGKKRYLKKSRRTYIETGVSYLFMFDAMEFSPYIGNEIYSNIETISLRKYQSSSIFNFNLNYGFSL